MAMLEFTLQYIVDLLGTQIAVISLTGSVE
jgi:hypothetical protein